VCVRNETVEKTFGLLKNCYNSLESAGQIFEQIIGLLKKRLSKLVCRLFCIWTSFGSTEKLLE
jgi:hypothetical protein